MKHTQGDNPMIELRAISEDNFRELFTRQMIYLSLLQRSIPRIALLPSIAYHSSGAATGK